MTRFKLKFNTKSYPLSFVLINIEGRCNDPPDLLMFQLMVSEPRFTRSTPCVESLPEKDVQVVGFVVREAATVVQVQVCVDESSS
ncbi:hypothetical protein MTR_3g010100 [Medicago truncatula]|uniref:Uncharacterized protein n=1 Tax=Medicago truncatula TaxID=3880 RepID=G7J0E8_MEDTR|nr:hypothetical protein MTR_3g010100 [Medicago truncatula]